MLLTGSYAYGVPRKDSDIDLVVLCEDPILFEFLASLKENVSALPQYETTGGLVLIFGRLNLLVCNNLTQYSVWKQGTDSLKQIKPVTRDQAINTFRALRMLHGIYPPKEE